MTDVPKLSRPAHAALAAEGLTTLQQIANRDPRELAALHGMSPKAIRILTEAIDAAGLGPWKATR